MKILIVAHSPYDGGAERALSNLVDLLLPRHTVEVLFPRAAGISIDHFQRQGIACHVLPMYSALPYFAASALHHAAIDFDAIAESLRPNKYDLVLSNTLVVLHGGLLAHKLSLPHISYLHEVLTPEDLQPYGLSSSAYLALIEAQSNHILCCSEFVRNTLTQKNKSSVLPPHRFSPALPQPIPAAERNEAWSILVIGQKSLRKNVHFSLVVAEALRMRGRHIEVNLIGAENNGSSLLTKHLELYPEVRVNLRPPTPDPFDLDIHSKRITLLCSKVEPFGLTIAESLQRGIPVIASRSGGPNELLGDDYLYDVDDVVQCVARIERVMDNPASACQAARDTYHTLQQHHAPEQLTGVLEHALQSAVQDKLARHTVANAALDIIEDTARHASAFENLVSITKLVDNLSIASHASSFVLSQAEVTRLIEREKTCPGAAFADDIKRFNVVPFGSSPEARQLLMNGTGLALNAIARLGVAENVQISGFIYLALRSWLAARSSAHGSPSRGLVIGDPLGAEAIRLAHTGYTIDYLCDAASIREQWVNANIQTALIANPNLKVACVAGMANNYDFVVCLEEIQFAADIPAFVHRLSEIIKPGGLLLLSDDCASNNPGAPLMPHGNRRYVTSLPLLALPYFDIVDTNPNPFGKPYALRRRYVTGDLAADVCTSLDKWIAPYSFD